MEEQPPLFADFPEDDGLVESVRRGTHAKPVVTGRILSRDVDRLRGIVSDLLCGLSQRRVATKWGVGRNSIRRCIEVLEERGELEPLKVRLARRYSRVAELAAENMEEALEAGDVPAASLPIMGGIAVDKMLLLTGEATQITERREVSIDDFRDRLDRMRRARVQPPNSLPEDTN